MSASLVLVVVMAVLYACGIYLILERSLTRVLFGFLLASNATTLLLVVVAGPAGLAPILGDGVDPAAVADPLPQALALTAIVITFGVSAFLLALIYRSWRIANRDVVADDRDDVAMRRGATAMAERDDGPAETSEFGPAESERGDPS